jgi:hypothetical protein
VNRNCLTSPQLVEAASDTASQAPADADVAGVAKAIVNVVDRSFWKHPFRALIDPAQDGGRSSTESKIVFAPRCTPTSVCQIY